VVRTPASEGAMLSGKTNIKPRFHVEHELERGLRKLHDNLVRPETYRTGFLSKRTHFRPMCIIR
jgi:hypothetical protein